MEIIHLVLGKANPDRMNGINKVVYQLATRQAEAGKNVRVWGITKDLSHNYGERNFKTELYQAYSNPFKLDEKLKKDIAKLSKGTVIHLHGGWVPVYYSLAKQFTMHDVPYVLTAHGAYNIVAMKRSQTQKKVYFNLFEKFVLENAKRIHCIGKSEVAGLESIYKNNKSYLQPYGFESEPVKHKKVDKPADFIFGFIGRIDIYTKGLDLIIEAFKKLADKHTNVKLWIIGGGAEEDKLKEMVLQGGLQDSVVFMGSKFGEEKNNLLRQMDVFVHPSRNEGLPASVLEASAFGIPSIVSKETNISQYIVDNNAGVELPVNTSDELYLAFEEMMGRNRNVSLDKMGENAMIMVSKVFSWGSIIPQFDMLYA